MGGLVQTLLRNQHQLLVAACLNLGPLLYGYALGWSAPMVIVLEDAERTPLRHEVSSNLISFVATALFIGIIIGPVLVLHLSNSKGRKPSMLISAATTSLSYVILSSASNIATIIAGRVMCGVGVSIAFVLNTVYLSELASSSIRGILLTTGGVFLAFGCLLVFIMGPYLPYYGTCLVGLAIAMLQLISIYFFVPESPLFHAMKGSDKDAISTLELLNRQDEIDEFLSKAKEDIKGAENMSSLKELFTVKSNKKAMLINCPLGILQLLSGMLVVTFFATTIFELAGSSIEPHIATIYVGLTQFLSSLICPIFIEKGGRRVLLMASISVCAVSLAVFGTFFYLSETSNPAVDSILWLPLVSMLVYYIGLESGFGFIPITLMGEMFSPNVRSIGSIFCFMIATSFGLLLSSVFPYMLNDMGPHFTFWIFSFICVLAFVYTYLFIPETRGKSLFEIQEILSR